MILRNKMCLFSMKLFEDHGIKVDRAERLSLSTYTSTKLRAYLQKVPVKFAGHSQVKLLRASIQVPPF